MFNYRDLMYLRAVQGGLAASRCEHLTYHPPGYCQFTTRTIQTQQTRILAGELIVSNGFNDPLN